MIFGNEIDDGFLTVAKLSDGSAFGELALLEQKPRMATIRCLKNTNFMVLSKSDYNHAIGAIERRTYAEKINFLKNIPIFSLVTRAFLGKLTYYFETKKCIKGSFLFKEGDPAEYVYIVKKGEFECTKKIIHKGYREECLQDILENPLRANKYQNKLFNKNAT